MSDALRTPEERFKDLPVVTAAGHRVVAPDYFGFGRSDKPVAVAVK
jgi:haloalkane dehalogenase